MPLSDEAIILAGGFGTRLKSVVNDVPKPLAPIRGRPFLCFVLDILAEQGFRKVVLATGYMGDVVSRTLGSRWKDVELSYSRETAPLGTGGAIAQAVEQLDGRAFFVLNGDTFLSLDYAKFEQASRSGNTLLAMALAPVNDVSRYGAVTVKDDRVIGFIEKGDSVGPGYINAGVYYMDRSLLTDFPSKPCFSFETDVLVPSSSSRHVSAFTDTRNFIDIGVPDDYKRAQTELAATVIDL